MTDDHYVRLIWQILLGREQPPAKTPHSQHREHVVGDVLDTHFFYPSAVLQHRTVGPYDGHVFEHAVLTLPIAEVPRRYYVAVRSITAFPHHDHSVRFLERQ